MGMLTGQSALVEIYGGACLVCVAIFFAHNVYGHGAESRVHTVIVNLKRTDYG